MTNQTSEIKCRLEIAQSIAHQAGKVTLQHFQQTELAIERKSDDSPVTITIPVFGTRVRAVVGIRSQSAC